MAVLGCVLMWGALARRRCSVVSLPAAGCSAGVAPADLGASRCGSAVRLQRGSDAPPRIARASLLRARRGDDALAILRYPGLGQGSDLRRFAQDLMALYRSGGSLPWEEAALLLRDATDILALESTLERVHVPPGAHINIVGDLHGQLFDLLSFWDRHGLPSETNPYVFNGDFVDRGSFSVETLLTLLAWKVALPRHVRLARGNHEAHSMNVPYGFFGEVLTKYGAEAYDACQGVFDNLPLAHVVNDSVLVVHGGLPRNDGVMLDDIEALDRRSASGDDGRMVTDLLWADPCSGDGRQRSRRGEGLANFGPDITKQFLDANGLTLLIRSHEVKEEGFEWAHNRRCLTVFSAPNYCDALENKGAVVRLHAPDVGSDQRAHHDGRFRVELLTFAAGERPSFYVPAMAYSPVSAASGRYLSAAAKRLISDLMGS
mmetsp:Transcript_88600/g.255507  ORF Transcript_88600/g.255507 Transcript_88600/m.255507 type:complete len:431 (-) Transcript_88600:24-1316(-)